MIEQRMDDMSRRCREAGMNVTPQRMAVYRALLESVEHPSPEVLYRAVQPTMPSMSLATVYKSLEALERLGLVHEVPVVSDTRRYDANTSDHHHLVCTTCGKVADFYDQDLRSASSEAEAEGLSAPVDQRQYHGNL